MRVRLLFCLLFISILAFAKNIEKDKAFYNASYNNFSIFIGSLNVSDQYFSNQLQSGKTIGFKGNHTAFYRNVNQKVSWRIYERFRYGVGMKNPSELSKYSYWSLNLAYGSHYNWRPVKGLLLKGGADLDIFIANKNKRNYSNNSMMIDVQLNLMASGQIQYKWTFQKWALALDYTLATPIVGVITTPQKGQFLSSIIFNLDKKEYNMFRCSSFHNRQGLDGQFMLRFIKPTGSFDIGFVHNHQWWQGAGLYHYVKEMSFQIGFSLNLGTLNGLNY